MFTTKDVGYKLTVRGNMATIQDGETTVKGAKELKSPYETGKVYEKDGTYYVTGSTGQVELVHRPGSPEYDRFKDSLTKI